MPSSTDSSAKSKTRKRKRKRHERDRRAQELTETGTKFKSKKRKKYSDSSSDTDSSDNEVLSKAKKALKPMRKKQKTTFKPGAFNNSDSKTDSSFSNSSSDDTSDSEGKSKPKKKKKMKSYKISKKKKDRKKAKKRKKKKKKEERTLVGDKSSEILVTEKGCLLVGPSYDGPQSSEREDQRKVVPSTQPKRIMVPMTKEEYEKQQSIVRRVYDPETGRSRLVKGDGEILEEIVSYARHKEINKQATSGDGIFFQAKLGLS